MTIHGQEEALLDDLYSSIVLHGDYAAVLRRLSPILGSHAGGVFSVGPEGLLRFLNNHNLCPDLMADYDQEYYKLDPWMPLEPTRAPGTALLGSKFADPGQTLRSGFYHHMMRPLDIFDIMNVKVGKPSETVIHFSFYRPHREIFDTSHARMIEALVPHIERAHRLHFEIRDRGQHAAHFLDALLLTRTERRIADLVLQGRRNAEISDLVGVSANTLKWHLRNIFQKAGVRSKAQMIARSFRRGTDR